MTRKSILVAALFVLICSLLNAQEVTPLPPQVPSIDSAGDAPAPLQVVAKFLQLQPGQLQDLEQLLQARKTAALPLMEEIKQRGKKLEELVNSGENPAEVGVLVLQIHALQLKVSEIQRGFLTGFAGILDAGQKQRLEAIRIAAQVQPVLPVFQQLHLF